MLRTPSHAPSLTMIAVSSCKERSSRMTKADQSSSEPLSLWRWRRMAWHSPGVLFLKGPSTTSWLSPWTASSVCCVVRSSTKMKKLSTKSLALTSRKWSLNYAFSRVSSVLACWGYEYSPPRSRLQCNRLAEDVRAAVARPRAEAMGLAWLLS